MHQHKHCTKIGSFPLRISSLNMTKSTGNCGLGQFTEEILNGKLHFLCSEIKSFIDFFKKTHTHTVMIAFFSSLLIYYLYYPINWML